MVEPSQYTFKHKDVVTALVKAQGLHEGIWQLTVNFGFGAANIGNTPEEINPAAIIPVVSLALLRVDTVTNPSLTVDAAAVNPKA